MKISISQRWLAFFCVILCIKAYGNVPIYTPSLTYYINHPLLVAADAPILENDQASTLEDTPVVINVLENDIDPNSDPLSLIAAEALYGSVVIDDDALLYMPDVDFYGEDTITYKVNDGHGGTSSAVVIVTVMAVNDAPKIIEQDDLNITQNSSITINAEHVNIVDPDNSLYTFAIDSGDHYQVVGTTITPDADFYGLLSIPISVSDGDNDTPIYQLEIVVTSDSVVEWVNATWANNEMSLNWTEIPSTTTYRIQAESADGSVMTFEQASSSMLASTEPDDIKRYRITACNQQVCTQYSTWSNWLGPIPATAEAPVASESAAGQAIVWKAVPLASDYKIEMNFNKIGWFYANRVGMLEFKHNSSVQGTREYRIAACNNVGCAQYSEESNTIGGPVPSIPSAPNAYMQDGSQHIDWQAVTGAADYKLQMNFNNEGWFYVNRIGSTHFSHGSILIGERQYRIAACNAQGCSQYSESSNTINLLPAIPLAPVAAQGESQVISWAAVAGAIEYKLQLNFNNEGWIYVNTIAGLTFTHGSSVSGSRAYRIAACNIQGCSAYSEPSNAIYLAPAIPSAPVAVQNAKQVISWTAVEGASEYKLQLNFNDEGWIDGNTIVGLTFSHESSLAGSRVYRIAACNLYICSEYSPPSSAIHLAPAIPSAPVAVQGEQQVISWTAVEGASEYKLQLNFNDEGWIDVNTIVGLTFSHESSLAGSRVYRIAACNLYICSEYSPPSSVIHLAPAIPSAPVAVQGEQQVISWTAVAGASEYKLQLNFNDEGWIDVNTIAGLTFSHDSSLAGSRVYRIAACNNNGCSVFSQPSNSIALGSLQLTWQPNEIAVGQSVEILGIDTEAVYCESTTSDGFRFDPINPFFYKVGISDTWHCFDADGNVIQLFNAELKINKLSSPSNLGQTNE